MGVDSYLTNKIRVTIDLDKTNELLRKFTSMETGSYGCDHEGAYVMWYYSRNPLVEFEDVEIINEDYDE